MMREEHKHDLMMHEEHKHDLMMGYTPKLTDNNGLSVQNKLPYSHIFICSLQPMLASIHM